MFRAYVILALSLFIGVMFIVDLYIVAAYINFRFGNLTARMAVKGRREPGGDVKGEDVSNTVLPGLGSDYGFGIGSAIISSRAAHFKYFFFPYNGRLTVLVPRNVMPRVPEHALMNYITPRVLADFRRQLHLESPHYNDYLGTPVRQGYIWVSHSVLNKLSRRSEELEMPRKKRSPVSLPQISNHLEAQDDEIVYTRDIVWTFSQ